MENPALGGASETCQLGGDTRKHTAPTPYPQDTRAAACVDELLVRLGDRLRLGHLTDWERQFALSVLGQAKRRGARWAPTGKQLGVLRRIIERPADDGADVVLIEEADHGPA